MNQQLFRKKSIDRVSSPEQLEEYIRVANPGIWMILCAIVVLLIGVCVWGVLGQLDTTLSTVGIARSGEMTIYVKEADISSVEEGMIVTVGEEEYTLSAIAGEPEEVGPSLGDYALHVGELQPGEWVYPAAVSGAFPDGVHSVKIVIERVSPMFFVLN